MHRFFADAVRSSDERSFLSEEDAHHAVTVLRLKPGQHVELIRDNRLWEAEIVNTDTHNVEVHTLSSLPSPEPKLAVTLFQGLPKGDKMDLIVQKATELGAVRIVPVMMNRCVSRPDPKDILRKLNRWRKIAREAGKQSGRCMIPDVSEPVTLQQIPFLAFFPGKNIVPWEEATGFGPLAFKTSNPVLSSLGILIGPEGGIEASEIVMLKSYGFTPVTLGKRILRTETAGLAAVAAIMSLYGEME